MLEEIERGDSLVEIVLQKITDAIATGQIEPDHKLIEARLAEQLGVSRGPVREAFRRLEQMGLVEKIPYRGTFVTELDHQDIKDLYRVRAALEGLAARMLAERRNTQDGQRLQEFLAQMQQAIEEERPSELFLHDAAFHDALIELTGNRLLTEAWQPVSIRMKRIILLKRERPYRTLHEIVNVHRPLVEAIVAGNPDRAEDEARRHVLVSAQNFWATYPSDEKNNQ